MIEAIVNNKEFLAIIVSFLTIIVPFFAVLFPFLQYLSSKSEEQKQKNQETFHEKIMKKITNQNPEKKIGLEEQVAVIFDLRNYPQYYSVTKRMLRTCVVRWKQEREKNPHFDSLILEATETLKYLNSNPLEKFFIRIKDKYM